MGDLVPRAGKAIHQFSFIDALVAGLLDGAFAASTVASVGDFGVGCGDALDGELVCVDGEMLLCLGDGTIRPVDDTELLPFAEITTFEPTHSQLVTAPLSKNGFEQLVETLTPSNNLFYAIRVDGTFASVSVREAVRQQHPYPGLADAVKSQRQATSGATTGTMVGFKGPDVFQGLSVADIHLHYLDDHRTVGGHVMDFEITSATLSIEAYSTFTLHLPEVQSYLAAELDDIEADAAIRQAESS